jgi:hypothetical protein
MSSLVYRLNTLLSSQLHRLPIGTNLPFFYLLWTFLSGRLLASREALAGAPHDASLPEDTVRRSLAALGYGDWQIAPLVAASAQAVRAEGVSEPCSHDGYHPVLCDLVGFFRPRLQGCPPKHYSPTSGKALPAISLGVAVRVGTVVGQAGAVLMYEAASQLAIAVGFWDRRPQGRIGQLRRELARTHFTEWVTTRGEIRKKASPTAHLPKGVQAHRRQGWEEGAKEHLRLAA